MAVTAIASIQTRARELSAKFQARKREAIERARRTLRVTRARAGYSAGLATAAWGVGVVFGFGWALITGGLATAWSFLHLYDVDEPS